MKMRVRNEYMRKIRLSNGLYAKVDDEDYEWLNQYNWRFARNSTRIPTGYAVTGNDKTILMHRLLLSPPDGMFIDHINNDKLDNRRSNLRIVTRHQNATNVKKYQKSLSSPYKGVTKEKGKKFYRVSISVNGRIAKIGSFLDERHAAIVYDLWADDIFGDYAGLNFRKAI